jgi:hypothetical protein
MMVVVQNGTRPIEKGELNDYSLYLARRAELERCPLRRGALFDASRAYATEALRSSPPVRPWGARTPRV